MNKNRILRDGSIVNRRTAKVSGISAEEILRRFRQDAARYDPPFYTVQIMHGGRPFVWLNVNGNVGWYSPEINADGKMIGIRSEASSPPHEDEDENTRRIMNYLFKLISPKQCRKLEQLIASHEAHVKTKV